LSGAPELEALFTTMVPSFVVVGDVDVVGSVCRAAYAHEFAAFRARYVRVIVVCHRLEAHLAQHFASLDALFDCLFRVACRADRECVDLVWLTNQVSFALACPTFDFIRRRRFGGHNRVLIVVFYIFLWDDASPLRGRLELASLCKLEIVEPFEM
jgi:hypothetical protein